MAVPKRKTSKSRRDKRSSTKGLRPRSVAGCQTCQEPIAPHQACKACGYYRGRKILATKAERAVKRIEVKQVKQAKQQEQQAAPVEAVAEEPKK